MNMEGDLQNTILATTLAAPDTAHNILNVGCSFHCEQDPGAQVFGQSWPQSHCGAIDPWRFTSLKGSQSRVPGQVSTRCLKLWGWL